MDQWNKHIRENWQTLLSQNPTVEDVIEFVEEVFIDPIYCLECGSCGDTPGCHHPKTCLYLDQHQGEYDDLVKEIDNLQSEIAEINRQLRERHSDWK